MTGKRPKCCHQEFMLTLRIRVGTAEQEKVGWWCPVCSVVYLESDSIRMRKARLGFQRLINNLPS